jgi:hypothetical protein
LQSAQLVAGFTCDTSNEVFVFCFVFVAAAAAPATPEAHIDGFTKALVKSSSAARADAAAAS